MRLTRLLASLFALAVLTATPLVAVTTADASTWQRHAHHARGADKAKTRKVTIEFAANGAASFRLTGKVTPKGKNLKIALLYTTSSHGKYHLAKKGKTTRSGSYAFTGLKKTGYYGVVAAPSKGFEVSASKVVKIGRH